MKSTHCDPSIKQQHQNLKVDPLNDIRVHRSNKVLPFWAGPSTRRRRKHFQNRHQKSRSVTTFTTMTVILPLNSYTKTQRLILFNDDENIRDAKIGTESRGRLSLQHLATLATRWGAHTLSCSIEIRGGFFSTSQKISTHKFSDDNTCHKTKSPHIFILQCFGRKSIKRLSEWIIMATLATTRWRTYKLQWVYWRARWRWWQHLPPQDEAVVWKASRLSTT